MVLAAYLGIIQRKIRSIRALWPMLSKPEKASVNPLRRRMLAIRSSIANANTIHTIENRLADSHDRRAESNQQSKRAKTAPDRPLGQLLSRRVRVPVPYPQVYQITDRLEQIEHALSGGEAVVQVPLFEPVHAVDAAVEVIRKVHGPV